MGLFSDPDRKFTFLNNLLRFCNVLCFIFYLASFIAFLALFHPMLREKTYFSENALLTNQAELTYNNEHEVLQLEKELKDLSTAKRQMPHSWIYDKLKAAGLEAYRQNFTVSHAYMPKAKEGTNVYGILRAPRHSSTESIVFVVPYESSTVYNSVPLLLSLAKHFRNQIYWAKDLIFVFSDLKLNGLQAWLQAYHGHAVWGAIEASGLEARGGSIQAALSLEFSQPACEGINFVLEGMNGQLPNLDLFNVLVNLVHSNDGVPYLHGRKNPPTRDLVENCLGMLHTSALGMWQQASGRPVTGHALFLPYHIDAVSLKCQPVEYDAIHHRMRYGNIARAIEGTVRSLNNLLERFHQSFFYYIMPSTRNYISIGLYIPSLVLCLFSSLIKAVALWLSSLEVFFKFEQPEVDSLRVTPNILSIFKLLFASFLPPIFVYLALPYFTHIHVLYPSLDFMDCGDSLLIGMLCSYLTLVSFPLVIPSVFSPDSLTTKQKYMYKSVIMFLTIIAIFSNSVANFSLSYFIALLSVPLMNFTLPAERKKIRCVQKVICLLISPLTLTIVLPLLSFVHEFPTESINIELCYTQIKTMLMKIVHESIVFNSSMLSQVWTCFIPMWLMHWYLLWVPVKMEIEAIDNKLNRSHSNPKHSDRNPESSSEEKPVNKK